MSICILAPGGAPCWGGYGKFSGAFLANVRAGSGAFGIHFLLFWGSRNPDHLKESMNITPDGQILHPKKGQELVRLNPEVNHFCSKSRNRYAGITVQSLSVASIGSVIQAGQTVATVIPGDTPLVLEADLPSQDIGFVKVGQKTQIKVTAYPFEQYGEIPGTVVWISPNAQTSNSLQALPASENHQPTPPSSATAAKSGTNQTKPTSPPTLYYRVRVQPERTWLRIDGKKQAMGPGMTATVDIRTGDRTVLDFFLDPVIRYVHQGLTVR